MKQNDPRRIDELFHRKPISGYSAREKLPMETSNKIKTGGFN